MIGSLRWFLGVCSSTKPITLKSVDIHDIETSTDRRDRRLKHLIKANHANHSILYNNLRYHNHLPHILGSAHLLGAPQEHLVHIYDEEDKDLEPWEDAPGELTEEDWRFYLGKKEYQRAFIDFFEDRLVQFSYDWRALTKHFLFEGPNPLINNLVAGLAHPLIHTGYAFELDSKTLAIESLAMACCCYNFLHKYLDDSSYSRRKSPLENSSLVELFAKISSDRRFDGVTSDTAMEKLFDDHEDALMEYWTAWSLDDPTKQFAESQKAASALLVGAGGSNGKYDFYLVHLLTSSHAVRILLPLVPSEYQLPLVRQWWLFTIAVYILQGRPSIDVGSISEFEVAGKDWKHVKHQALQGKHSLDAHYVKALRAMEESAKTWGDEDSFYLRAALEFGEKFAGWV